MLFNWARSEGRPILIGLNRRARGWYLSRLTTDCLGGMQPSIKTEMTYQGTAPHLDSSHLSTVEHVGAAPTASVSFTPEGITWRVDIAKYFGTVPGQDVAVLLLRSADWGVKSWTVKGQTTYCSRSFSDWEEAQQVLEDVRQEGFEGATLVQD